jgi:RHS repeat-associated protein
MRVLDGALGLGFRGFYLGGSLPERIENTPQTSITRSGGNYYICSKTSSTKPVEVRDHASKFQKIMDRFPGFVSYKRSPSCISAALFLMPAFLFAWILLPGSACAQLYVAQDGSVSVGEYNATSGAVINANYITISMGISYPTALALTGNTLFVANAGANTVGEYDVSNPKMGVAINADFISAGLSWPIGLAISGTNLYVANGNGNASIGEYNTSTAAVINSNFIPAPLDLGSPSALAVSSDGSTLFVAHYQQFNNPKNPGLGSVSAYDAKSGALINGNLIIGLKGPAALEVSGDTLYVVNSGYTAVGAGSVGEYSASTGTVLNASFIPGLTQPFGIATLGNTIFVAMHNSGVASYNASNGALLNANFITQAVSPYGLAVTTSGPEPEVSQKNSGGMCPIPMLAGDPINVGTGNLFETQTDFTAAPETQLSFTRYYNSFDSSSAGLGVGWHSTYHRRLSVTPTAVTVTRADGRQDIYTKTASGYVPDPDVTNVLTPVPATGTQTGWKLKLADDSTEIYTLAGLLTSITTRAGLTTTLTYNTSNQLSTVIGPFGHMLTFTYDTSNRVSTMTVPDGGRFTYLYDGQGNLASVTHPDSTTRRYFYQNTTYPDLLTGLIDESGNLFASWTYDSQGRATSSQHAGGVDLTTVAYASGGGATVTDARGNVHTYTLTTQFNLVKPTAISGVDCGCSSGGGAKAFTYDSNGFVSSMTDFDGNVTTYVHNALGEETSRTEASGTALARTITATWSTTFHLPTKIVEPNRTTTFTYDASGNLLTKSVTDGTHTRTWTYTYNTHGQVLTAKDPDNHVTTTTYDAKGDIATVKNALNQVASFTSYDADGKLLSVTDPNALVTAFTYDPLGRVLTKKVGTLKTSYAYAPPGMVSLLTMPDGSAYKYIYDAAHRLTQITDKEGDAIDYSYDATSNLAAVNVYDPSKTLTRTHSYTYDTGNRLASDTGATAGEKTTYTYDNEGNLLTRTDPLGHVNTYTYDALNRRASFLDALNGKTTYTYDENDDLTAVVDPRGLGTVYTYNGLGDQTGVRSPDTGATTRTFDAAGNVLTSTDARAKVGTYKYDALNRPVTITWTGGETITYTYDTGTYGIGHLAKMVDLAGNTSFTYNQFGQVLTKSQVTGAVTLPVTYTYDAFGRLSTLKYPSGKLITYSYDTSGRISALSTGASGIAYVPFGPAKSWTEPNGATYARTFDKDVRINEIALGGTVNVQTLTYDNASRITHLTETGLSAKTYGYDNDDRLTSFVNGTATTSYGYDADSNRSDTTASSGATTYHYSTTSNRLSSLSGLTTQTETYDASGNLTGDGTVTYGYDARGRMSSATAAGVTTSYAVNAFGERIRKTGSDVPNGAANEYVYDEQGHLLGEYSSTGSIVNETVYLADTPVAVLSGTGGATVYSVSADWLSAPHIIQNASKQDIWTWDHFAFGDNGPNQNPAGLGGFTYNLRFPGQYEDAETALNYNYFRDYNPKLGRYIKSDPLGLIADNNTYSYANDNPISNVDSSGLYCVTVNGQLTCQDSIDNGPRFTVAAPSGFPESILPTDVFYHHYDVSVNAGNVDYNCLLEQLINNPTPGPANSPATAQGSKNNATPANWHLPPSLVTSYLTSDSNGNPVIVNVTNSFWKHGLYPGYVARTIVRNSDGTLTVNNYGEGDGILQSRYDPWAADIDNVWGNQTKRLIEACACNKSSR